MTTTTSGTLYGSYAALRFVQPYITYSTTSSGWIPPITYASPPSFEASKEQDPPEIDRKEWSDFMDSDNE